MAIIRDSRYQTQYLPGRGASVTATSKTTQGGSALLPVEVAQLQAGDKYAGGTVMFVDVVQGVRVRYENGAEKFVPPDANPALTPYIEKDGSLNVVKAVKGGITAVSEYAGWNVTAERLEQIKKDITVLDAMEKLSPYKTGDNSFDVYKAIQGGADAATLKTALGISDEDYQAYKATAPYVKYSAGGEVSVDLQAALDDLNKKSLLPAGTRVSGITPERIEAALKKLKVGGKAAETLLARLSALQNDAEASERIKQYIQSLRESRGAAVAPAGYEGLEDMVRQLLARYGGRLPARLKAKVDESGITGAALVSAIEKQFGIKVEYSQADKKYTIKSSGGELPKEIVRALPDGVTQAEYDEQVTRRDDIRAKMEELGQANIKAQSDLAEFRKWLQSQPNGYSTTQEEQNKYEDLQERVAALGQQIKAINEQYSAAGSMLEYIDAYRYGWVDEFKVSKEDMEKFSAAVDPGLVQYITGNGGFDLMRALDDGVSESRLKHMGFTSDDFATAAEYKRRQTAYDEILKILPGGITTNESIALALQAGLGDQLKVLGVDEKDIDSARSWQLLVDKGYVNAAGEVDIVRAQKDGFDAQILSAGFTQEQLTQAVQFNQLAAKLSPFIGSDGLNLEDAVKAGLTKAEDYAGWNVTQADIDAAVKFNDEHVKVADQYFLKADIDAMKKDSPELYELLTSKGIDAYNAEITRINAAYEKQKQTLKKLEPYRTGPTDDDITIAMAKGKQLDIQYSLEAALKGGDDKTDPDDSKYRDLTMKMHELNVQIDEIVGRRKLRASSLPPDQEFSTDPKSPNFDPDLVKQLELEVQVKKLMEQRDALQQTGLTQAELTELFGKEAVDATLARIAALDKLKEYTDGAGHRIVEFMADKGAKEAVPALLAAGYTSKTVAEASELAEALKILRGMGSDDPLAALWSGNKEQIEAFKKLYPDYDTAKTPVDKMGRSVEQIEARLRQKIVTDMGPLITTSTDLEGELARTAGRLGITYFDKDLGYSVGKRWALLTDEEKEMVAGSYSPETTLGAPLYQVSRVPGKVSKAVEDWIDEHVDAKTQKDIGTILKTVTKFSPSGLLFFSDTGQKVVGAAKDAIIDSQEAFAKFAAERGGLASFGTNAVRGIYDLTTSLAGLIPIAVITSSADMQQGQLGKGLGELAGLGVGFLTWPANVGMEAVVDPVGGSGYALGLFLGPAAIRRIANSTRTYIDPYGIPKEAISIEYATGRIPVGKFNAKWESGMYKKGDTLVGKSPEVIKEAQRQFLIKALQGLTKNPDGTVIQVKYKGVVITGRITPMGATAPGIAWHGTENITPYRALKPGQELTVSPKGLYFDPFAAPRFLAGGAGGRPIVAPGYTMLITEPAKIKYLANNPGAGKPVPSPGLYAPGSLYKGSVETQVIAAPGSTLMRPEKPNLRQRLTAGKATEFFTTYNGPNVPGLSNGQIVPITVLLDKGVPGSAIPTPKELYAMKLAIIKTVLTDFVTALKHPGRTLRDIVTGRIGPPGVRDADISFYQEVLDKAINDIRKRSPREAPDTDEAFAKAAEEILEEALKDNPDLEAEYATPEGRRRFEKLYRSALERIIRAWAATRRRADVREVLPREFARVAANLRRITRETSPRRDTARTSSSRRTLVEREILRRVEARLTDARRADQRRPEPRVLDRRAVDRVEPARRAAARTAEPDRTDPRRVEPARVEPTRGIKPPPPPPPKPRPPIPPPRLGTRRPVKLGKTEKKRRPGEGAIAWRQGSLKVGGRLRPVWITVIPRPKTPEGIEKIVTLKAPEDAEILKQTPEETFYTRGKGLKHSRVGIGAFDVKIMPDGTPRLKFKRVRV